MFAGQYFDKFEVERHIARAETLEWQPWWPRWISIDWGFEHPAATYWHAQAPGERGVGASVPSASTASGHLPGVCDASDGAAGFGAGNN